MDNNEEFKKDISLEVNPEGEEINNTAKKQCKKIDIKLMILYIICGSIVLYILYYTWNAFRILFL